MLSFTWISKGTDDKPTVVTIDFLERGTGTELVLTHRRLAPTAIEGHRQGWTDVVRLLERGVDAGLAEEAAQLGGTERLRVEPLGRPAERRQV